ncbi:MAG TPA: NADH-quinone oxidoreductase subunit J [Burkholderiaceae bacterium]|nr:NADH-quinone oxidoreductase subunit J [Burkholderiaceae bacterium]
MTFTDVLFYVLSLILIYAAFRVIAAPNPVTAVLHLILAFFTTSMLWILLGAEFLGLVLVLVYVGAVLVLFLFVIMMLDTRMETLRKGFRAYMSMGLVIGLIMVLEMAFVLGRTWFDSGAAPVLPDNYNNTRVLGNLMFTEFVYAVEVGAVILLVGMVSAIALTLRRRSDVKALQVSKQVRVRAQDRIRLVDLRTPSDTTPQKNNSNQELS